MHACPLRALFTPFALRRPRTPFPSLFDLFDVIYYDVLWPRGIRMGIIFHGTTEDVTTRTVTSTVTAWEHASLNTQAGWIECTRPEHTTLFWYISAHDGLVRHVWECHCGVRKQAPAVSSPLIHRGGDYGSLPRGLRDCFYEGLAS